MMAMTTTAGEFGASYVGNAKTSSQVHIDSPMDLEGMGLAGELDMAGKIDVYDILGAISCVVSKLDNANLYQVSLCLNRAPLEASKTSLASALSPEKPKTPLKRTPEAQPTPRTEPMTRMARSPGEAYAAEATQCLGPSPSKRYRCKDPELLVSSIQRLRGKTTGPVLVTMQRNAKLCQAAHCVFSTGQPGQPARATADFCMWCDSKAMTKALSTPTGRKYIKKALTFFEQASDEVFEKALLSLPEDFHRGRADYCRGKNCVFNFLKPGHPAYLSTDEASTHGLCAWCNPTLLAAMVKTHEGAKAIRRSLTLFEANDDEVFKKAQTMLPNSFYTGSWRYSRGTKILKPGFASVGWTSLRGSLSPPAFPRDLGGSAPQTPWGNWRKCRRPAWQRGRDLLGNAVRPAWQRRRDLHGHTGRAQGPAPGTRGQGPEARDQGPGATGARDWSQEPGTRARGHGPACWLLIIFTYGHVPTVLP